MKWVKSFLQLGKNDARIAGGKGASLGEMTQAGIPVPEGYVILSSAFERFLEEADLNQELDAILHTVKHEDIATVERASEKIKALIVDAQMPQDIAEEIRENFETLGAQYVAVRSSATAEDSSSAAWAGQLDTFLNTTEDKVLEKVQHCWASLFTPRAIFYRFEKGMHGQKISVAVVVQKMIASEYSGIAFSVHPVTEDRNQLIIEAGFGLGEAIVSGQVTPDSYVVEKEPRKIIDKNISAQTRALHRAKDGGNEWLDISEPKASSQVLTDDQILDLSKLILKIENHYGFPCDIEWAFEGGKFYITQSRPITTLSVGSAEPLEQLLREIRSSEYTLVWGAQKFSNLILDLSIRSVISNHEAIGNNLSELLIFNRNRNKIFAYSTIPSMEAVGKRATEYYSKNENIQRKIDEHEETIGNFERFYEDVHSIKSWKKEPNTKLSELFNRYTELMERAFAIFRATREECETEILRHMREILVTSYPQDQVESIITTLVTVPTEDIVTREQKDWLKLLKQKWSPKGMIRYAEEYPANVLNLYGEKEILAYLKERRDVDKSRVKEIELSAADEERKHIAKKQKEIYETVKSQELQFLADALQKFGTYRFKLKYCWTGPEIRSYALFEEIARRVNVPIKDFFDLYFVEDVSAFLENGVVVSHDTLRGREQCLFIRVKNKVYSNFAGEDAEQLALAVEASVPKTDELSGQVAYPGFVQGAARMFFSSDVEELRRMEKVFQKGDILVAGNTDPSMISFMKKAGAVVAAQGGITSHASIISREYKIPCVVGVKTILTDVKDGDQLEVDANRGVVRVLSAEVTSRVPTFKKRNYKFVWGNIQTMQTIENNTYAFVYRKDNPWHVEENIIEFSRENRIQTYYSEEDFARSEEVGKMFLNEASYWKFVDEMEFDVRNCWKYYARLKKVKNFQKLDTEALLALFNEGQEHWRSVIGHFKATQPQGINALLSYLKERILDDDLSVLLLSSELDEANKEVLDWWKIVQKPFSEKNLIVHAYKYPWIASVHFTYDDVIASLRGRYDFDKEHGNEPHLKQEKKDLVKKQRPLLKKYADLRPYIDRIQRLSLSRMEIKAAWSGIDFYLIPIMSEITRRSGEALIDLNLYYRIGEIENLVRTGERLSQDKKEARRKCFVGLIQEGNVYYFEGEDAERIIEQILGSKHEEESAAEVRGVTAYHGRVQGIVRILHANDVVRSRELRSSFKKEEILVTEMTQPNIIDIAARAGAIVTDEGSLLSHAAIVSRELKIPCIVHTTNATKALSEGDLVEVDATNGIVRVLKSHKVPNPSEYVRMFSNKSFPYILTDIFNAHYHSLGVVCVQDEEQWMSFLPKSTEQTTLTAGKELYTSRHNYAEYEKQFRAYMADSTNELSAILHKEILNADDSQRFFHIAAEHFIHYSKTEFFYTGTLDLKHMIPSIQEFDKLKLDGRSHLNRICFENDGYVKTFLKKTSTQTGVPEEELLNYGIRDITRLLSERTALTSNEAGSRDVFFTSPQQTIFGEEARAMVLTFVASYRMRSNVIRGTIASPGRVSGKARVLISDGRDFDRVAHEVHAMEKGEILVAETTSPELMLACKKAAAIVTNQGGQLSHAAIVARELNIPCIIGTDKDVVLNIKTGDTVEVDAENGVIRII